MDGNTYNNIFDTKGIEYLIIITFLLLIIPFWLAINNRAYIKTKVTNTIGALTSVILKIPKGLFYSRNHTWTHLERTGIAKVGLDDLLLHITGEVKYSNLRMPGSSISKGELLVDIDQNGKRLQIFSPISGKVISTNSMVNENPGNINEDPYGKGWIYKIKPTEWIADTKKYFFAEEAIDWSKRELERFKDFMAASLKKYSPENSLLILQDGGELHDKPLSELPDEVWQDFQKTFLSKS